MTNLQPLMYDLWETACIDAPQRPSAIVRDGHFVMTIKGNRDNWQNLVHAAGVPSTATQTIDGDTLTCRWPSHADAIFGPGGMMAKHFGAGYEVRMAQVHMARLVQRSIEMNAPTVIEAGTGTGKSFAYAAIALAMGKKLIISTSNKNLQMQLIGKDLPFLSKLFPGKTYALAQGKNNYACRAKAQVLGEVAIIDPALRDWYINTENGNVEEIPFAVERKDLAGLTADDECTGRHCNNYHDCFYYAARERMKNADVIVTNHKLLCIDATSGGNVLPPADVIVVDEAHKLADYARSTIGVEFTMPQVDRLLNKLAGYISPTTVAEISRLASVLFREVSDCIAAQSDTASQVGISAATVYQSGNSASAYLLELWSRLDEEAASISAKAIEVFTDAIKDTGDKDCAAEESKPVWRDWRKVSKLQNSIRSLSDTLLLISNKTPSGFVRWIEPSRGDTPLKICAQPFNVSEFIGGMAGVTSVTEQRPAAADHTRCHRCTRTLTAANVAVLDGKPFGPECIHYVDAFGDAETVRLSDWLAMEHAQRKPADDAPQGTRAIVFCSATLAAPDMGHFLRTAGLPDAMQMIAPSPFDYETNALLYVPSAGAPLPSAATWLPWAIDEMRTLVLASMGGAFLLFTSYKAMNDAAATLRPIFQQRRLEVFVQGELPKLEIARRFKANGNAVLFATKSFFEGVSIDGDALRLVVVDKMPFEAPSPLTTAMEADATEYARNLGYTGRKLEMYAFDNVRVPRMIIELKQATGRLIRTATDRGVMAVLDSRLRASQYGRNAVLPALPPATLTTHSAHVEMFFAEHRQPAPAMPQAMAIPVIIPDINLDSLEALAF